MKTVLFIDDNAELRENMSEILELANYNVLLAENGKEGVALAIRYKPDVIICDIMMPELDGYGVIHLLQKNPETQSIPFIFLTAKTERIDVRKGMELGADDYITKPFSGTELLNAIEGRLKKSDLVRQKIAQELSTLTEVINSRGSKTLKQVFEEDQDCRDYKARERIYSKGHNPYRLYYLVMGKVKIYKSNSDGKDLITGICKTGEFFGYTALLEGRTYEETAEAMETTEICSITREAFEQLMNDNPTVTREFIKMLAGHVREREEQLLGIAYNSLRKKVANALVALNGKYRAEDGSIKPLHVSRDVLASMAGTAKESLVRTLGDFRDEKLIDIQGGDILILQEKKLANLIN
jgi:CRP-like cAMP-binding protein